MDDLPKFNILSVEPKSSEEDATGKIRELEKHVIFEGSDVEVKVSERIIHIYPPKESYDCVLSLERIAISSFHLNPDEVGSLEVSPLIEEYHKRSFLGARINLGNTLYFLHRINKAPLAPK